MSLKILQKLCRTIKPLYSFTNPEIFVKIRLVVPEINLLRDLPLKIKKKTLAKYIARRAGTPGWLNQVQASYLIQISKCLASLTPKIHMKTNNVK